MGENADDLIEGMTCSGCGMCFVEDHGFPVLCEECWSDERARRKGRNPKLPLATAKRLGESG